LTVVESITHIEIRTIFTETLALFVIAKLAIVEVQMVHENENQNNLALYYMKTKFLRCIEKIGMF